MEKNYVQIHGTAMGTKMAVAFANIFMAKVTREEITQFTEQANKHNQTIKFINFSDTTVYKDERFKTCPLKHSLHPFFNPPPIRSKKKLHQRRGSKTTQN